MTKVRTQVTILALVLLSASLGARPVAAGEVIDRIVATVNGRIILDSDWNDALRYEALLSARTVSDFNAEERRAVLDQLIDQELLGEQMNSALFKHATEDEALAQVAQARQLYPQAATDEGWKAVLARFGLSEKALVEHLKQQIDLMRLVDAHLRPTVEIDSKSIEAYYRDQFIPQLKQSGAGDVPLEQVSAKIRELLTQQKMNQLLTAWLQNLRASSEIRTQAPWPTSAPQAR